MRALAAGAVTANAERLEGELSLDFTFSNAADTARGKCRMLVVPQRGRTFCLGSLDPARADAMLATIAEAARA